MSSLYDLQALAFKTECELEENGGELTEEIQQALSTTEEQIPAKIDAYKGYLDFLKGRQAELDETIKAIQAKKKAAANAEKSVREFIKFTMKAFGLDKIKGEIYTASLRTAPSVEVDEDLALMLYREKVLKALEWLPDWVKVEIKVDKTIAKKSAKDMEILPAGFSRGETDTLTIR